MNDSWNRCDVCGRFIPLSDFDSGVATRKLETPDSEFTAEELETLYRKHVVTATTITQPKPLLLSNGSSGS